jgi:hypothetical protein
VSAAIGIRLQYATEAMRALIVQALREKADVDREAGTALHADAEFVEAETGLGHMRVAEQLSAQADLAEQIADELEGA